jgi:hypothetical protein
MERQEAPRTAPAWQRPIVVDAPAEQEREPVLRIVVGHERTHAQPEPPQQTLNEARTVVLTDQVIRQAERRGMFKGAASMMGFQAVLIQLLIDLLLILHWAIKN